MDGVVPFCPFDRTALLKAMLSSFTARSLFFFSKAKQPTGKPALPSSPLVTSAACMGLWRTPKGFTGEERVGGEENRIGIFSLPEPADTKVVSCLDTGWRGFYSSLSC